MIVYEINSNMIVYEINSNMIVYEINSNMRNIVYFFFEGGGLQIVFNLVPFGKVLQTTEGILSPLNHKNVFISFSRTPH